MLLSSKQKRCKERNAWNELQIIIKGYRELGKIYPHKKKFYKHLHKKNKTRKGNDKK